MLGNCPTTAISHPCSSCIHSCRWLCCSPEKYARGDNIPSKLRQKWERLQKRHGTRSPDFKRQGWVQSQGFCLDIHAQDFSCCSRAPLLWGGPADFRVFSSISGLSPLDASRSHPGCDNHKSLQTLPSTPGLEPLPHRRHINK